MAINRDFIKRAQVSILIKKLLGGMCDYLDDVIGSQDLSGLTASVAELNYNDITTLGTVEASKTVTADANKDITGARHLTITGNFVTGATTLDETDLAKVDAVTNGTVAASKAVVVDANKGIDLIRVGRLFENQDITPETAADTATLTDVQHLGKILVATPTGAAAYTTLTGELLDDAVLAVHPSLQSGDFFDLTIINLGGAGDDITLTAAVSGITIVGNAVVTQAAPSQGTFRHVRGAADTWVIYRIS